MTECLSTIEECWVQSQHHQKGQRTWVRPGGQSKKRVWGRMKTVDEFGEGNRPVPRHTWGT